MIKKFEQLANVEVCNSLAKLVDSGNGAGLRKVLLIALMGLAGLLSVSAQPFNQPQYFSPQTNQNYMRNSSAFRQEIARFEITVSRAGKEPLPLNQVPRVQKDDIIKVKLLDEAVNGIKLDQSLYDWTLLVSFINPNRKFSGGKPANNTLDNKLINQFAPAVSKTGKSAADQDRQSSVSQEIQFRKTGWYKEYSFIVPYDSQPVLFLYPRPKYRDKIMKLVNKNYNEVRKLGEKTIELAGAYAQISSFLNDLQGVLNGTSYGYGSSYGSSYGGYGGYNSTPSYGNYGGYNSYNPYGVTPGYNYNQLMSQTVERLAKSFNIQLPTNCWQGGVGSTYNSTYGSSNGLNTYGVSQDMVSRVQCIAKNVRLEDFDLSVSKLLQQGGVLAAAQLAQKYPQFIYWINLAAAAIDFIVKITKKSPLRIVPAITQSSDNPNSGMGGYNSGYQSNYSSNNGSFQNNNGGQQQPVKISLFAESQPDDSQFVTAYPIVLHKWQAEADPEIISLRPPVMLEPCLHAGINVLKSTDLLDDQIADTFTRDYTLEMTSENGFKKEFPLKKNIGLSGWELNISPQDLASFPKIQMSIETIIKGTRGFNEIKSPPFKLPIAIGGSYEITANSQQAFSVGGKRTVTIKNSLGNCQCVQSVIYQPSFGGQFVFEAGDNSAGAKNSLQYSPDGSEISFELDATNFQPGPGTIEIRTFGGDVSKVNVKLYPAPPTISDVKIRRGDREFLLTGNGLEQVQSVMINGKRATNPYAAPGYGSNGYGGQPNNGYPTANNQPVYQSSGQAYPTQVNTSYSTNPAVPNAGSAPPVSSAYPQNTLAQNQKVFILDAPDARIDSNSVSMDLTLEDNRLYQYPQKIPTLPSRPSIIADEKMEITGNFLRVETGNKSLSDNSIAPNSSVRPRTALPMAVDEKMAGSIVSIDAADLTITTQNKLTDYNFRRENLLIETGIEGSASNPNELPQAAFEVLDSNNLRINFSISAETRKYLGGRRIKFRIKDQERGDSDWYVIKQTFVRFPQIEAVKCSNSFSTGTALLNTTNPGGSPTNPNLGIGAVPLLCEMNGIGLDYVQQVSIDGGVNWFPSSSGSLQAQLTSDGRSTAMIPLLSNKKALMIKLRDYPAGSGIFVERFVYLNTVRTQKKTESLHLVPNSNLPNTVPKKEEKSKSAVKKKT